MSIEPTVVNSTQFCDWRVQTQGNCEGVTYVSFLYTTHIISSFLFLFISIGILIHNIWWKGQKIWEFSRNDRAFRPRPTEGFVFWCTGYFFCKYGETRPSPPKKNENTIHSLLLDILILTYSSAL